MIRVYDNQFVNVRQSPIRNAGQSWVIQGNVFEPLLGGRAGAYSSDPGLEGAAVTFVSNWFGDASDEGVWVNWSGNGLVMQGNYFSRGKVAVMLRGEGALIAGNVFAGKLAALDLTGNPTAVVISGNSFSQAARAVERANSPARELSIKANSGLLDLPKESVLNIRTIITKESADAVCPADTSAIYTPREYLGLSGQSICAANVSPARHCHAVKYMYVTVGGRFGVHAASDVSCTQALTQAWPWGYENPRPDSLGQQWSRGDTRVVCCAVMPRPAARNREYRKPPARSSVESAAATVGDDGQLRRN
jgi:hypothetical protein